MIFAFACLIGGLGMAFIAIYLVFSPLRRILVAIGGLALATIGILTLFYPQLSSTVMLQLIGFVLMALGIIILADVVTLWWRSRPAFPHLRILPK
jgi:uncharacterized membrane protein HdeD (DUF308 family)